MPYRAAVMVPGISSDYIQDLGKREENNPFCTFSFEDEKNANKNRKC